MNKIWFLQTTKQIVLLRTKAQLNTYTQKTHTDTSKHVLTHTHIHTHKDEYLFLCPQWGRDRRPTFYFQITARTFYIEKLKRTRTLQGVV